MWRNNVYNLWCFVAFYNILLQNQFFLRFTLFCREISFGMIYALLRGEKFSQKLCLWRKITNMRYAIVSSNGLEFQMASTRREKGDWDVCTDQDCTQTQRWPKKNLHSGQEWPAQVMAHMRSLNWTDGLVNGVDQWPIYETSANATGADNLTSVNLGKCMNFFTIRFSCHPRNHCSVVWVPRPERPSRGPSGPAW